MKSLSLIKSSMTKIIQDGEDGFAALLITGGLEYEIVFSYGGGWEHASIVVNMYNGKQRIPDWDEMCMIKDVFWWDEETVVQYHPAKSKYVDIHGKCLHLWRPTEERLPEPPVKFV